MRKDELIKLYEKCLNEKWIPIAYYIKDIREINDCCIFCYSSEKGQCFINPFICNCFDNQPKSNIRGLIQEYNQNHVNYSKRFKRNFIWIIVEALRREIQQLESNIEIKGSE